MTIIDSVKAFILKCPYLEDLEHINIDYLKSEDGAYSIEEEPTDTIIQEYVDGSSDRQFVFVLATTMLWNDEVVNNISNCGFFENFQNWLEDCSVNEDFPEMPQGLEPYKIEAMSSGYLFGVNENQQLARYQIQCRLLYSKEG